MPAEKKDRKHTFHQRTFHFHQGLAQNERYWGMTSLHQTLIGAPKVHDGNLALHLSAFQNSFASTKTVNIRAYSGSDIFCKFVKKSLLRIVEADKMLPERLVTTFVTSSGSAMPSARSTRFSGFKASIPSANSSFSNVLITDNTDRYTIPGNQYLALPGRLFTKASKVWYVCKVSGSVDCKYAWKTMSSKYRRRF